MVRKPLLTRFCDCLETLLGGESGAGGVGGAGRKSREGPSTLPANDLPWPSIINYMDHVCDQVRYHTFGLVSLSFK